MISLLNAANEELVVSLIYGSKVQKEADIPIAL